MPRPLSQLPLLPRRFFPRPGFVLLVCAGRSFFLNLASAPTRTLARPSPLSFDLMFPWLRPLVFSLLAFAFSGLPSFFSHRALSLPSAFWLVRVCLAYSSNQKDLGVTALIRLRLRLKAFLVPPSRLVSPYTSLVCAPFPSRSALPLLISSVLSCSIAPFCRLVCLSRGFVRARLRYSPFFLFMGASARNPHIRLHTTPFSSRCHQPSSPRSPAGRHVATAVSARAIAQPRATIAWSWSLPFPPFPEPFSSS